MNQRGFSLLEIMLALAITSIMLGIATPFLLGATQAGGESLVTQNYASYKKVVISEIASSAAAVSNGQPRTFPVDTAGLVDMLVTLDGNNPKGDPGVAAAASISDGTIGAVIQPCMNGSGECVLLTRPAYGALTGLTREYWIF